MIRYLWAAFFICLSFPVCHAQSQSQSVRAKFSGTLVENNSVCSLYPGDEHLTLPLSMINLNTLKSAQESPRYPFTIRLENCQLGEQTAGSIEIYLSGQNDGDGMLLLDSDSSAAGVVIGIENMQGVQLPINATSAAIVLPLSSSELLIQMQAYVKVTDSVALNPGKFKATLNYVIAYLY